MSKLQMTVNGRAVEVDIPESRFLSEVIREDLGLTGTKIGCNEAECGICTVLVNGTPVVSCSFPALKAQGAEVETIESLSSGDEIASVATGVFGPRRGAVRYLHTRPDHDLQGLAG